MKRRILIVGAGRLGTALARRLSEAGYPVSTNRRSRRPTSQNAEVAWFCVPDAKIVSVAKTYSDLEWRGRYAFHSSGALTSDALAPLRESGARVASVHPLMTFVKGSLPDLKGVPFAIEGEPSAASSARKIVRDLGGIPLRIERKDKTTYHAFATMVCPLLVSLLATTERAAGLARISERGARRRMMPIIRQTLRNYANLGPAGAFSGPIVRGDVETIRAHLRALKQMPPVRNAYVALARAALEYLPNKNRKELARLLAS